jgi:hypothetical protein
MPSLTTMPPIHSWLTRANHETNIRIPFWIQGVCGQYALFQVGVLTRQVPQEKARGVHPHGDKDDSPASPGGGGRQREGGRCTEDGPDVVTAEWKTRFLLQATYRVGRRRKCARALPAGIDAHITFCGVAARRRAAVWAAIGAAFGRWLLAPPSLLAPPQRRGENIHAVDHHGDHPRE